MSERRRHLSVTTRLVLAGAGLATVVLTVWNSESDPGAWRLLILAGMFLAAALLGFDPVAAHSRPLEGTFWVLAAYRTPRAQPFRLAAIGLVMGGLYSLVYGTWRHAVFGAGAGLVWGAAAPLCRYRILAWLVVSSVITGFILGIGEDAGFAVFVGGTFGFVYAALFWGDSRYDPLLWSGEKRK